MPLHPVLLIHLIYWNVEEYNDYKLHSQFQKVSVQPHKIKWVLSYEIVAQFWYNYMLVLQIVSLARIEVYNNGDE